MKKKLELSKEPIAVLNEESLNGVRGGGYTSGCTDGLWCASMWRCTHGDCTNDCPPGVTKEDLEKKKESQRTL